MKNPLMKRIPKELATEWHKYLVIIIFMVVMIGVISGMYVGHDSMLAAVADGREALALEDGSFELKNEASPELLAAIESGRRADVRQYYIDKATAEADEEVAEAIEKELRNTVRGEIEKAVCAALGITDEAVVSAQVDAVIESRFDDALAEARETEAYQKAAAEAYDEAHKAVIEAVDEEWDDIAERYDLNGDFSPVPVTLYESFYHDEPEDWGGDGQQDATIRVFPSDAPLDRASFLAGRAPERDDEIAIDRMHADNVGVTLGDSITVGGREFKVVGLLSYVHYLTLHQSNTDLMFDAFGFDVGMVTPAAFAALPSRLHYNYAWQYESPAADKVALAEDGDHLLQVVITQALVH